MVETIGEAWQLGWRITARFAFGKRDGMKSIRACVYGYDLDLKTLISTRGRVRDDECCRYSKWRRDRLLRRPFETTFRLRHSLLSRLCRSQTQFPYVVGLPHLPAVR